MEIVLPVHGHATLDANDIVSNDTENMLTTDSDGKLCVNDALRGDSPSVRMPGTWVSLLDYIRSNPQYAQIFLGALLEPYRESFARMRSKDTMPDTFEEFLSVLTGVSNG